MSAQLAAPQQSDAHVTDLLPFTFGGVIVGAVAAVVSAMIDATVLGMAQYFAGSANSNAAWPQWAVIVFTLFTVVVAIVIGRWLFGLRRWVGTKGDPEDQLIMSRKRRHFTVGAMVVYAPLAIAICGLMLAIANTT